MKTQKIISILLVGLLMGPEFLFAGEKSVPPVPSTGNVTLSLDEYNRLLELASKPARKVDTPPVPYTMKRADLKFRVSSESVQGTVQLQGETLHKGVTKVALTNGMAILDAHLEGRNLPLQLEGGTHTALLSGPAEFAVTLDAGLPLNIEAGRASFTLPVPAAGSVRLNLSLPGDHTNVRISPGLITSRTSENGQTTVEATLVPGQNASIWWTTREIAVPTVPKEVRFLSDVKTLVTVSESDLRIAALADVSVVQGEPAQFELAIPAGYEVTGATGASVESAETQSGVLTLKVRAPTQRNHQFLISMEKSISETKTDAPFLTFQNAQRETGEVLVEGAGTIELTTTEGGGLKRMDFRETNPYLRSLARFPLQAAFRYHRQPNEQPSLALAWTRFPDSSVLAAVAERAIVTTLVTNEGRSLTEVKLMVKNQAQPYLKVALPAGASILSAEVAGEKVKPVEGSDGNRVPLLRPGLRQNDSYPVSFVFMHSGSPFAKKGGSDISLPKMDIPIDLLQWEVFLPERYKVKDFGGDAIAASLLPPAALDVSGAENEIDSNGFPAAGPVANYESMSLLPGQLGGMVVDQTGAVVANAQVTVTQTDTGAVRNVMTDSMGRWVVSNLSSGNVRVAVNGRGFKQMVSQINYDGSRPVPFVNTLSVNNLTQTVEVTSGAVSNYEYQRAERDAKKQIAQQQLAASVNVTNLKERISGILPVRVEVPRAGNSYHFVRPLVLDEETRVTFTYKSK
ncbi:MAG TPA: carboxypeptidase-like regulatory domain-containing protein [Candidatus Angelobacter sp.]|nr:carboxypeptidase-like regulatory domain-containing protein [Candidatus Angelobacter sp.]